MRRETGDSRLSSRQGADFRVAAVCGLLVLAVVAIYGQTLRFDFVNCDDNEYVYENPHVLAGLSRDGVVWALTSRVSAEWTPLTILSLMADAQMFLRRGAGPPDLARLAAGMHAVNLALHAANAVLLFLVLRAMTACLWRSALAAAIFAVHPLHVESVAWITERKDVLSGLFGILALAAYAWYARRPGVLRYLCVAAALTLGLLAKPMLATWPLVFLLLDYWPLRRKFNARLFYEKVPLLLLVACFALNTYRGQQSRDAVFSLQTVPLSQRIARAAELYVVYLGNTLWPVDLAANYPEPAIYHVRPPNARFDSAASPPARSIWSYWPALASGALLVALTAAAFWGARRGQRWLATGWLWYLITLAPVIGLVRVGAEVRADRFLYLPQIGLTLALVWGAYRAVQGSLQLRRAFAVASLLAVIILAACAGRQASYWKDSVTLWTHTLACTSGTWAAHNNLGIALYDGGRPNEAIRHFVTGVQIRPDLPLAHFNLGLALARDAQFEKAVVAYTQALRLDPDYVDARVNLADALDHCGRFHEAVAQLRKALEAKEDSAAVHDNLGIILARHGEYDEAIQHYRRALQINPDLAGVRENLRRAEARRP